MRSQRFGEKPSAILNYQHSKFLAFNRHCELILRIPQNVTQIGQAVVV